MQIALVAFPQTSVHKKFFLGECTSMLHLAHFIEKSFIPFCTFTSLFMATQKVTETFKTQEGHHSSMIISLYIFSSFNARFPWVHQHL